MYNVAIEKNSIRTVTKHVTFDEAKSFAQKHLGNGVVLEVSKLTHNFWSLLVEGQHRGFIVESKHKLR
jgi:hypothetical protein